MKSLTKLGALVLPLVLITGCATHSHTLSDISDVQAVKDHFGRVEAHVGKIEAHLLQVENTANVALTTARDANSKVDRMFHKAMSK
jgi:outer membrane murein-binding lipoprotein Lpp|tara:strand:+ start:101 stop:358 length:258 start_codon:yes stop_codon:yes gene_type:complete